jgi:hypothetical protein
MIISISTMAVLIIVVVLKHDSNTCGFKMLLSLVRRKIHYEGSTTVYLPHKIFRRVGKQFSLLFCDYYVNTLHYLYQPQKRRQQQQRTTANLYLSFHHLFSYRTWCHNFFILFFVHRHRSSSCSCFAI